MDAENFCFTISLCAFEQHVTRNGGAADPLKYVLYMIFLPKNIRFSKYASKLWKCIIRMFNFFFQKQKKNTPLTLYKGVCLTVRRPFEIYFLKTN
jgi:hypothetical protein